MRILCTLPLASTPELSETLYYCGIAFTCLGLLILFVWIGGTLLGGRRRRLTLFELQRRNAAAEALMELDQPKELPAVSPHAMGDRARSDAVATSPGRFRVVGVNRDTGDDVYVFIDAQS